MNISLDLPFLNINSLFKISVYFDKHNRMSFGHKGLLCKTN